MRHECRCERDRCHVKSIAGSEVDDELGKSIRLVHACPGMSVRTDNQEKRVLVCLSSSVTVASTCDSLVTPVGARTACCGRWFFPVTNQDHNVAPLIAKLRLMWP